MIRTKTLGRIILATLLVTVLVGCSQRQNVTSSAWTERIKQNLPVMGHRNGILIADSAYPLQSNESIQTVATGASQIEMVNAVLQAVDAMPHVRPVIFMDKELSFVPETNAPGIDAYRAELKQVLGDKKVNAIPHMDLINKLDETAALFNVLVLKTDMLLPYTSVYVELDCGYWSAESEAALRKAIEKK